MVNRCNFCKESEELADHILIHCTKRRALDLFISPLWGGLGFSKFSEKSPLSMES